MYKSRSLLVRPRSCYKGVVPERVNRLLAERADALVRENFTGVHAPWWWERRIGGGLEVC